MKRGWEVWERDERVIKHRDLVDRLLPDGPGCVRQACHRTRVDVSCSLKRQQSSRVVIVGAGSKWALLTMPRPCHGKPLTCCDPSHCLLFRATQQHGPRSEEITQRAISCSSEVDKTRDECQSKTRPYGAQNPGSICCEKPFYAAIIQVSEQTRRISTCAKTSSGCVLTYYLAALFFQQGWTFLGPAHLLAVSGCRATLSVWLVGFYPGDDGWRRSAGRGAETQ